MPNTELTKVYKVVEKLPDGSLVSCNAPEFLRKKYSADYWTLPDEQCEKVDQNLLAFNTRKNAESFIQTYKYVCAMSGLLDVPVLLIFIAEAVVTKTKAIRLLVVRPNQSVKDYTKVIKTERKLRNEFMTAGDLRKLFSWPKGTVFCERIKLEKIA